MIIRVHPAEGGDDPHVELVDAAGFTGFHIEAPPGIGTEALAVLLGSASAAADAEHVFVGQDALRQLAGDVADDAWNEGFAAMVEFADSKGWLDGSGAIRAHVERV